MVWWGSWKLGGLKLQKSHICPFFSLDHFDKWKFHITKSFQQQKYWIVQPQTCFQTERLVTKALKQLEGTTAGVTLFGGIGGRRGREGQVTITSLLTCQPGQVLGDPCVHKCFSPIVAGCNQSTVCSSWGNGRQLCRSVTRVQCQVWEKGKVHCLEWFCRRHGKSIIQLGLKEAGQWCYPLLEYSLVSATTIFRSSVLMLA